MSPAGANSFHPGLTDIGRCVEIGFADLEVNHVPTLGFERPSTDQDFERRFCPEALHSGRESHLTTFNFTFACTITIWTARAAGLGCKHNGGTGSHRAGLARGLNRPITGHDPPPQN